MIIRHWLRIGPDGEPVVEMWADIAGNRYRATESVLDAIYHDLVARGDDAGIVQLEPGVYLVNKLD